MASGRRIARELAVIVMPQLPKEREKLEKQELDGIVSKSVRMLCDYAKQNLADANSILLNCSQTLSDIEFEHPRNKDAMDELRPVPVTTGQLADAVEKLNRAMNFVAEALDVPDLAMLDGANHVMVECKNCGHATKGHLPKNDKNEIREFLILLITVYVQHRKEIDDFIKHAKAKWNVDRMVSIDRDILRLACAEAFFIDDVPVNVAISEAVELAHRFADEKAAKFINGVLSDLSEEAKHFRLKGSFKERESSDTPADESLSKL
ncbi:MAG TPA: transcription antitermination factor NusB [Drouetiella sp.]